MGPGKIGPGPRAQAHGPGPKGLWAQGPMGPGPRAHGPMGPWAHETMGPWALGSRVYNTRCIPGDPCLGDLLLRVRRFRSMFRAECPGMLPMYWYARF